MKHFCDLFARLDQTTATNEKLQALVDYLQTAHPADASWAIALLSHRRPKRSLSTRLLAAWAAEQAAIPLWLFEETYHSVGDLAETISLILPPPDRAEDKPLHSWMAWIRSLETLTPEEKKQAILAAWQGLPPQERFVFNKLITGGFRVGVSQPLVVKALAQFTGRPAAMIAHRLMGPWSPDQTDLPSLLSGERQDAAQPYPFYLAYPLDLQPDELGAVANWQIEPKWDGIRGQLIVRNRHVFIWSRGEELVTNQYPELTSAASALPDGTVLDGEILAFKDGHPLPFQQLQKRIGRSSAGPRLLRDIPVCFMVYDLLEWHGEDWRTRTLAERRRQVETLISPDGQVLRLSPRLTVDSWAAAATFRERARDVKTEGLMLKRLDSVYREGRKRGDWWKWKREALTIDAVLIYAMKGHGRRANLYTDYTFAVWHEDKLLPIAKAYSGLTDTEIMELDRWIKENIREKFGPVRSVVPRQVFELAFEGIQLSNRHKSGVALRFPRIHRWRKDKQATEADRLPDLLRLIQ